MTAIFNVENTESYSTMSENKPLATIDFETENDITVFAVVSSSPENIEYSEQWLDDQLTEYGCPGLNVLSSAHEKLAELIPSNKKGRVMLGYKVDAEVDVAVSDDQLSARLYIKSAEGGVSPNSKDFSSALTNKDINLKLVDKKHIVDLVIKSQIVEPGETVEIVIANGRAPQHGQDSQFECLLENVTDRTPNARTDGSIDYYDLGEIPCVDAGCQLMKKTAPTPAKNGRSVTGLTLKAKIGKTLKFSSSEGAEVSPVDPELLVSTIKGQPVISDRGITIEKVHMVNNVDVHTGHIEFDGSLLVKGDVASGMKINVTGDVQVFGMVENACIDAGGNIDIKLSAIGRADSLGAKEKMQINCKGNLSAGQLQNVYANVQGDVLVKSRISNSEVIAGHQIIVGNPQQNKSGIVGGFITAGSVIRAEVLGSTAGTLTTVSIACSDKILEDYESIKQDISEHEELLGRMLSLAVGLAKKNSTEAKGLLSNVKKDTKEIKAKVNEMICKKYDIEASIEHTSTGKIIVQKEAHHGVTVKIMLKEQQIKSRYSKGVFLLFDKVLAFNAVL